jgi:ferredoxin
MAKALNRTKDNVSGRYYVDDQCIACDACINEAPAFFKMNDEEALAYVFKQPISKNEIEACENALAACPVDAIGNNG